MIDPNKMMFRADRESDNDEIRTVDGKPVMLVAIQKSRRGKKDTRIYHIVGTNIMVFKQSKRGVYFMRMALRPENINRYYNVFVNQPLTSEEKIWLGRYDYELV